MQVSSSNAPQSNYPTPAADALRSDDLPEFNPLDYILQERIEEKESTSTALDQIKVDGVRFNVEGNLVNFKQDKLMLPIQDIYMRVINEELLFSVDQKKWLPFGELFAFDCNFNFPIEESAQNTELSVDFSVNTLI